MKKVLGADIILNPHLDSNYDHRYILCTQHVLLLEEEPPDISALRGTFKDCGGTGSHYRKCRYQIEQNSMNHIWQKPTAYVFLSRLSCGFVSYHVVIVDWKIREKNNHLYEFISFKRP